MIQRDFLSWWFRPRFLQPWGKPADTLFAGPWIGEFGWEIMNWQPFLRRLSRSYEKVVVCCRQGSQALYEDFASEFVTHTIQGVSECNSMRDAELPEEWHRIRAQVPKDADFLPTVGWRPARDKEFIRFGNSIPAKKTDFLFHPRGRMFGSGRNWSRENWQALLQRLTSRGLKAGCIGLTGATLSLEGDFTDFRDIPLKDTMDLLASTRLLLGPSSGPVHLASLCGTPHLVWTDRNRYARGKTNRDKYEKWWNPLGTKAIVLDGWGFQPPVELVEKAVTDFIE